MKKFVFTLQVLLGLKESQEKQQKSSLAAITRRLNRLLEEKDGMLTRRQNALEAYGGRLSGGMLAQETRQYTDYFRMMKELIEEQDERIRLARQEIEACRQKLVEITREIKMLENLKDRQYQAYLQELQLEQEKTIGDFVSFTSTRKPAG